MRVLEHEIGGSQLERVYAGAKAVDAVAAIGVGDGSALDTVTPSDDLDVGRCSPVEEDRSGNRAVRLHATGGNGLEPADAEA